MLVALNMSGSEQKVKFDLGQKGGKFYQLAPLVMTPKTSAKGLEVTLEPFGVFIGDVTDLNLPVTVDRY